MSHKENNVESAVRNLFHGTVRESDLFPYPILNETQKELSKSINDAIDKFAKEMINSSKFDEEAKLPDEIFKGLSELGLMGMGVPEEFGGLALDYSLYARTFGQVATHDGAIATTIGAHQSIGYRALLNEGTKEQKEKWLARLASGEVIAAFALTEPGSGSDAYSIKTKATENSDGTYTINGQKLWISNAGRAGFYTVFAKTVHHDGGKTSDKISCFIVEADRKGVTVGEKENKMGIRASETRAVYLDNVIIPKENLVGEKGKGFKIAMNVLNSGRLSLASGCTEAGKMILKLASEHAANRKQFDRPIAEFGLIQDKLTNMAALSYSAESAVYMTTGLACKGLADYSLETAVCKVFASEALWQNIDMAMQIAAGNGYMKEYPYERIMRDARINLIFEGTNEILRIFLALSGLQGPSEGLKELGKITDIPKALQDPIKSLGVLTDFAKRRVGNMMGTKTLSMCHHDLEEYSTNFSAMLGDFAISVENTLMTFGKDIIGNELPQGRIANMAIELYVTLAVLSRTTSLLNKKDLSKEKHDYYLSLSKIALRNSRKRFMSNLKEMRKNYDKLVADVSTAIISFGGANFDIVDD